MPDPHHWTTLELSVVGDEKHFLGLLDNGLGDSHFAVIEIEKGAVLIDAAYPDDSEIHSKLADEIDGCLTKRFHDPGCGRFHPPK